MNLFGAKQEQVIAIIDIGSARVGGALVVVSKDRKPEVVYTTRRSISKDEMGTIPTQEDISNALPSLFERLSHEGQRRLGRRGWFKRHIDDVVCVLSHPWQRARVATISRESLGAVEVTQTFVAEMIKEKKDEFVADLTTPDEKHPLLKNPKILDQKIISARLNGYETSSLYGKTAHGVELVLYAGVASGALLSDIRACSYDAFGIRSPHFHSFPLTAFTALRDIFSGNPTFMFIDVTRIATDVLVVNNGSIQTVESYPVGFEHIVTAIAKEYDLPYAIARSYVTLYLTHKASTELSSSIERIIFSFVETWLKTCTVCARKGSPLVFLTTDIDMVPLFTHALKRVHETSRVTPLTPNVLEGHIMSAQQDIRPDLFLLLETIFVNKLYVSEDM